MESLQREGENFYTSFQNIQAPSLIAPSQTYACSFGVEFSSLPNQMLSQYPTSPASLTISANFTGKHLTWQSCSQKSPTSVSAPRQLMLLEKITQLCRQSGFKLMTINPNQIDTPHCPETPLNSPNNIVVLLLKIVTTF